MNVKKLNLQNFHKLETLPFMVFKEPSVFDQRKEPKSTTKDFLLSNEGLNIFLEGDFCECDKLGGRN